MTVSFAVTWDYRCPFARNAHEHVLTALEGGADWDVHFIPFSLDQIHVAEGETDVWDEPGKSTGILSLQAGTVVRDRFPEQFRTAHRALFSARHDEGLKLQEPDVVRGALEASGVDADEVFAAIEDGTALKLVREEHEAAVETWKVWGVPTFCAGDQGVFVRLMTRSPKGSDPRESQHAVERVVDLLTGWTDLNEFKRTYIPR